ncbi:hypothetical protein AAG570_003450 [Ranatra chinensis]|uniref:ABC transporter domain-containing protein n=1 Tax=Ranatra chinensis TaxID=642074 RepID=A0ABD0Y5Y3_9HEMI
MGPSGAGKSSLLNILTGFQTKGMSGKLSSNGRDLKPGASRRLACYIMQEDHLNPLFTVYETMMHSANLKIGNSLSEKGKQLIIGDILDTLGLDACRHTRCSNLSGGQRKRLSIALELMDNPPVMFLDEPTTGLDSRSTVQLVTMLQGLARGGRTIICTIHQPSATIFEMFDQVYVISEGHCVYQGSSCNVVPFLQSVGLQCPQYHNPADFLLDLVTGEFGDFTDQLILAAKDPSWRISPRSIYILYILCIYFSAIVMNFRTGNQHYIKLDNKTEGKACVLISNQSEWSKVPILLKRTALQLHRDWTVTYLKLVLHILVSILLGLAYLNAGSDADKAISNLSYILVTIVYLSFTTLIPASLKLPAEIKVLKKEYFNNWYKFRTFYIAFLLVNIPLQAVFCLIHVSCAYYLSSQILELDRFLKFLLVTEILVIISETLGLSFGIISKPVNGVFVSSVMLAVLMLFTGYLVVLPHMPKFYFYLSYVSFLRYCFEAMTVALYGFGRAPLHCPQTEIYCHFKMPSKILGEMGLVSTNYWTDVGALLIFVGIFLVYSYVALNRKLKSRT